MFTKSHLRAVQSSRRRIARPFCFFLLAVIPCGSIVDFGALAQLGERLHGMQEVEGSNPLGSIRNCLFGGVLSARVKVSSVSKMSDSHVCLVVELEASTLEV